MRTFAEHPKSPPQAAPAKSVTPGRAHAESGTAGPTPPASTLIGHDLSQVLVHPPGDAYEPAAGPSMVDDVLRTSGQPLDPATRAFMEPRFGHDFSRVRVHTDAQASASARLMNASAYTVGRHIVFGASQLPQWTAAGRRLLAHELAHVVQQQRAPASVAHGLGTPGDAHERHAATVAETWVRGGDVAGVLDTGPGPTCPALQRDMPPGAPSKPPTATTPPPRPLDYDRSAKRLPPVPRSHTAASLTELLNAKVKKGDITRFAVTGVQRGSRAEIFLLALLYGMAKKAQWGTEADVVTAIDWPAKPTDPAPQGRVADSIWASSAMPSITSSYS